MDRSIRAVVQSIVPHGRHGPYAVARTEKGNLYVTFALAEPVWNEERFPEPGTIVLLDVVYEKRSGYRAERASRSLLTE